VTVWAHHMFVTGGVLLPYFALLSFLIAAPTGIKFFNWIGSMWKGSMTFASPIISCLGFLFIGAIPVAQQRDGVGFSLLPRRG
jgi:cytochrome c oxidase subunit 1